MLLSSGAEGRLECEITASDDGVHVELQGRLPDGAEPHGEGFAWSILKALAHDVSTATRGDRHVVSFTRSRGPVLDSAL